MKHRSPFIILGILILLNTATAGAQTDEILGVGYWSTWNGCTEGRQAETAALNGGAAFGYFLVEDVIPQTLGSFQVSDCATAVSILNRRDAGTFFNRSNDAAYQLASQLLAYRFNIATGRPTCVAAAEVAVGADLLLTSEGYSASGPFLPPSGDTALRAQAVTFTAFLDMYNNGLLCAS